MLRIQPIRIELHYLRGRASLAVGDVADARRCAAQLTGEGPSWSQGMGALLLGGVSESAGDEEAARVAFRRAADAFERASMRAFGLVAQRRLAELQGDDTGELDRALALRRVGDPSRFAALLSPRVGDPPKTVRSRPT